MAKGESGRSHESTVVTDRYVQYLLHQTQVLMGVYEPRQRAYSTCDTVVKMLSIYIWGWRINLFPFLQRRN